MGQSHRSSTTAASVPNNNRMLRACPQLCTYSPYSKICPQRCVQLGNPRFPVPNEYLAGWALTQNDTVCLQRFQDMGYTGKVLDSNTDRTGIPVLEHRCRLAARHASLSKRAFEYLRTLFTKALLVRIACTCIGSAEYQVLQIVTYG